MPNDLKEKLLELQYEFRDLGYFSLVKRQHMHLTLKFFGDIPDKKVNEVKEALKEIKFKKFDIEAKGLGVFPSKDYIKILWVSVKSDKLYELQTKIQKILRNFPDDKKFHAHLTLARVKKIKDKEKFKEKLKNKFYHSFHVNSFNLFKSKLTSEGPIHEVVESYELS